jgi:hypothetical protein
MLVLANAMFDSPPVFAWVLPVIVRLQPGKEETFSPRHGQVFFVFSTIHAQNAISSCGREGMR